MSKIVNVSDDSGSTWHGIPGPEASMTRNGEQISDAILGQTYDSQRPGLITWAISASGFYKGVSGYAADLKKSGSLTTFAAEAMTLVSGKTYRITNAAKEVWASQGTFQVFDGVTDVTVQVESYDYLFGRITFLGSYTVLGAVTITSSAAGSGYYPLSTFGKARDFNLTQTANALDTSDYQTVQANGGYRTHSAGLRNVSLELSGIFNNSDDWDTQLATRSRVLIEIDPAGDTYSKARGWFYITDVNQDGSVGDNENESVTFSLNTEDADAVPFSWQHHASSTLSTAIIKVLEAFQDQTDLDVQYLYNGTAGWEGTTVVTEASLSGSIDGMNEFSFSFTGDGAHADV